MIYELEFSSVDVILQLLLHLNYVPGDLVYMAWHIHDLFTYFDDDDFSWDLVYVYTIFWENIQVLQRGDIIVVN